MNTLPAERPPMAAPDSRIGQILEYCRQAGYHRYTAAEDIYRLRERYSGVMGRELDPHRVTVAEEVSALHAIDMMDKSHHEAFD
ncbi:hypothetical protein HYZ99_05600 [Candidatus Peregrinibacteria bacterium]|nr:hypothetical protein [Candidatus Peregrinibacteria bacterium]